MLDFSKFKSKKIKCAGVGEVLFDVFPSGPKIGGAPANFAYHCRQNGLEAVAISSVGRDELGFRARDWLAARFLPALLLENDKVTGAVNVSLSSDGVPAYTFVEDTAYDNIPLSGVAIKLARELDLMCFGKQHDHSEQHSAELAENRSYRRAADAHFGERADTENQQRVKDNIDYRAEHLEQHRVYHISRCLQGFFNHHLNDRKNRKDEHDTQVIYTELHYLGVFCK